MASDFSAAPAGACPGGGLSERAAGRLLAALLLGTTLLRLWLGWFYFGFLTGDDVEILEAGFRTLGLKYLPWEIRNTLLSDLLVGPVLGLAHGVGITSTPTLIWIASWPFVVCATLNVYLLFRVVRAWTSQSAIALVAACLYAFHWIPLGFGSMAYPRTVSTTCVLLGALLVSRTPRAIWRDLLAGGAIALACAPRYSEVIFLPAVAILAAIGSIGWRDRILTLLRVGTGFAVGLGLVAGVDETVTWGKPFAALIAFARFTLLEKQASALVAAQPWHWYLWRVPHWLCPATIPFLWKAVRNRRFPAAWAFVLIPLAILSYIHHKELRYLQGLLPFLCAILAAGAVDLWQAGWRRTTVALALIVVAWGLVRVTFLEKKSMPSVLAARAIASDPTVHTFAGVQMWAFGDHLYLGNERSLRDIPFPTKPSDLESLAPGSDRVAVYAEDLGKQPDLQATLTRLGFCGWQEFSFHGSKSVAVLRPCSR